MGKGFSSSQSHTPPSIQSERVVILVSILEIFELSELHQTIHSDEVQNQFNKDIDFPI